MNKHHPEQRDDEIYMGNTTPKDFPKSSWITKRMGSISFDINNNPLAPINQLFPWFIAAGEIRQEIKNELIMNNPCSAERILCLQPMVDNGTVFID